MLTLLSGLFLGWSLGANHGGSLFGPPVGARMISHQTAALVCSVFVVLGAVVGGSGTTATLVSLGAVTTSAGAFITATAAGATVAVMSKLGLPVSTSQTMVGALVGWNLFAGLPTPPTPLASIVAAWVAAPLLAAAVAAGGYLVAKRVLLGSGMHLLTVDALTRWALVMVAAFGAYSLGANNIANVMGPFVPHPPLKPLCLGSRCVDPVPQLFGLGGLAIALGILTYSRRVVSTVGRDLLRISPISALVVLFSHALVLFLFSSRELSSLLASLHLGAIPLVPVSSAQTMIGALMGVSLVTRAYGVRWKTLGEIAAAWVLAPPTATVVCLVCLFVAQNVFELGVRPSSPHPQAVESSCPRSNSPCSREAWAFRSPVRAAPDGCCLSSAWIAPPHHPCAPAPWGRGPWGPT